ncbi:MAG TPA: hypothetical protein DCM87_18470, partial [Planctomycetes bacterium]|nr:hypothetical protein [Planctomycetota bacterium]
RTAGVAAVCLAAWFLAAGLRAQDWPQWRGPNRDGSAPGAVLPANPALKEVWKVPAGAGYSGPVVADGKVIVFCRRGEKETILCLDARTGAELWTDAYDAPFKPEEYSKVHGKGPFSTPSIAGGKAYLQGIAGVLSCYDLASGKLAWRKDFSGEFKKPYPLWGAAASPLIEGKLCLAWIGTEGDGALAAFDKDTGALVWKAAELEPSYSSPVAADLAGTRQVVALTRTQLVGVDPAKGATLWSVDYRVKYEQGIVTPIVRGDTVVIGGYEQPTLCVRVAKSGAAWNAAPVWSAENATFFMPSPIPHGDFLYGLAREKKGALACIDMRDGKVQWMGEGGLGEYASMASAGNTLLVLTAKGSVLLVAADPGSCRVLARLEGAGDGVWSHAALADGALFVKDKTHIARYALEGK